MSIPARPARFSVWSQAATRFPRRNSTSTTTTRTRTSCLRRSHGFVGADRVHEDLAVPFELHVAHAADRAKCALRRGLFRGKLPQRGIRKDDVRRYAGFIGKCLAKAAQGFEQRRVVRCFVNVRGRYRGRAAALATLLGGADEAWFCEGKCASPLERAASLVGKQQRPPFGIDFDTAQTNEFGGDRVPLVVRVFGADAERREARVPPPFHFVVHRAEQHIDHVLRPSGKPTRFTDAKDA